MPTLRAPKAIFEKFKPPEPRSAACLNCDTALAGPFCPACGQRDIPPYPSVQELVVDAFWELSGWDGRFAATVRKLFTQPGALTVDFLQGRRVRYLSPLRLYLMASLVYFLLAALAPTLGKASSTTVELGGVKIGTTTTTTHTPTAERVGQAVERAADTQKPVEGATRDSVLNGIKKAPKVMQPLLNKLILDPAGFKRGLTETMPRVLFALLPIYAAIVALFYRRHKYPEHLYFAIHLHAFIFVALSFVALSKFTRFTPLVAVVNLAVVLWIPVYATLAYRRAYGGSVAKTIAKEIGIGAIYLVVAGGALLGAIEWVAVFG
jgi:hypothetical protein